MSVIVTRAHRNGEHKLGALPIKAIFWEESSNVLEDMPSVGVALATCSTDICSAWVVSSCLSEEYVGSVARAKKRHDAFV